MARGWKPTPNQASGFPQPLIQCFDGVTVSTNASGDATYTFPTAFPNGLHSFCITEATAPGTLGAVVIKAYPKATGSSDRTKVAFRSYASTTGAVIASFSVTVNIIAAGW